MAKMEKQPNLTDEKYKLLGLRSSQRWGEPRMLLPTNIVNQISKEDEAKDEAEVRGNSKEEWDFSDKAKKQPSEPSAREKREAELAQRALVAHRRPVARKREIAVFDQAATDKMRKILLVKEKDPTDGLIANALKMAIDNNGIRTVPRIDAGKTLRGLDEMFPNFADMIDDFRIELSIAEAAKYSDFWIRPILLDGAPGIGKTRFAQALADRLGVPLVNLPSSVLQVGAALSGSSGMWSNTQPGRIFRAVAESKSAVAVVLLDELDKLGGGDERYPILPALLQLLERDTARRFADASAEVEFDASKLIIIGTSNYLDHVDATVRSRMSVYKVREPDVAQRMAVMRYALNEIAKSSKKDLVLDEQALRLLAEDSQHDLRACIAAVRKGFGRSLTNGKNVVVPVMQDGGDDQSKRRGVGFMAKF